jgi:hypothetical protein
MNNGEQKMTEHKHDKRDDVRYVDLTDYVKDWKKVERRMHNAYDEGNCCIICGRDTSTQKNFFYTIGLGNPLLASHKDDLLNCEKSGGYMGEYPIGSECVKQILKDGLGDYIHKGEKKFKEY